MKSMRRKIAMTAGVAAFVAVLALTAFSQNSKETSIRTLDSVGIDGGDIYFTYTVNSKCAAGAHDSWIGITTKNKRKVVNAFNITIVDEAYESGCHGTKGSVTVTGSADLAQAIADKTDEMEGKGFKVSSSATFVLPPVRTTGLEYANTVSDNRDPYVPPVITPMPIMVTVTEISYTPGWRCVLYKNDGSRNDGFEGNGATLDEARRAASNSCKSTNSPSCDLYSKSPDHTNCEVLLQESTRVSQYDSNKLPPNTILDSWACLLNKNDGTRSDGFTGVGKNEADARADAANKCSYTNNPNCNYYSTDNQHTTCAPKMVLYGPKPVAAWKCTLSKNDGSRNDGFPGAGATEQEARNNTIPGCQRTNNQYCTQYANDPAHTQCSVDFVYPQ